MRVVVGLGNPGAKYAETRHNVGFAVLDELATRWHLSWNILPGARMADGVIAHEPVVLVAPQLYMNRSGAAVQGVAPLAGAAALVVVHDDLDLERGCVRVKCGGGTAGHRGLDSIVERYGEDFSRVRIGIGRPAPGADVADYVLSAFAADERETMADTIGRAADAVECILHDGVAAAMNRFNARPNRPPAQPAA